MAQRYPSFVDLGWDPRAFLQRLDTEFVIQHRDTLRFHSFGELLRANDDQWRICQDLLKAIILGGRVRRVYLKSRKKGISTFLLALQDDLARHCPGFNGAVLSHTTEGTDILIRNLESMHANMDGFATTSSEVADGPGKVKKRLFTVETPVPDFGRPIAGRASTIAFATARGMNPFIGSTLSFVHVSELGRLQLTPQKVVQLMTALLNAVPPNGPSVVVFESTAQGVGNAFHDYWKTAERNVKDGRVPRDGEFVPVFLPAYTDKGHRQPIEPGYNWMDWDAKDLIRENALVRDLNVPLEYLRWRRNKIQEIKFDFRQYQEDFPDRPEDAFLASGTGVIDPQWIDRARGHIKQPAHYDWSVEVAHAPFGSDAVSIIGRGDEGLA